VPYKFLSDEWIDAAKKLREDAAEPAASPQPVKMNLVITDVPFGEGTVEAHMDTTSGAVQLDMGHVDGPDVTATLDYDTARAMMVDNNPQAGMQAFMAGKIKLQGHGAADRRPRGCRAHREAAGDHRVARVPAGGAWPAGALLTLGVRAGRPARAGRYLGAPDAQSPLRGGPQQERSVSCVPCVSVEPAGAAASSRRLGNTASGVPPQRARHST
jgi:hypothetical protein